MKTITPDEFLLKHYPEQIPSVVKLREQIKHLCKPEIRNVCKSILLKGDIGTGKSFFADVIGAYSAIVGRPETLGKGAAFFKPSGYHEYDGRSYYKKITLPGRDEQILQSELFGHVKGAFTGAHSNKPGVFQQNDGEDLNGIVFLDEIGHISKNVQLKLLQLLNDGTYSRVGSSETIETSSVIIMATNRDLNELVQKGSLLPDLFSRVQGVTIELPGLKDVRSSINTHIEKWMKNAVKNDTATPYDIRKINPQDRKWAEEVYDWPHNIRQLHTALENFIGNPDKSFKECVKDTAPANVSGVTRIKDFVEKALDDALKNKTKVGSTPTSYARDIWDQAQEATYAWHTRHSKEERKIIFTDHKNMDQNVAQRKAIRKKIKK